jgi:hypothetical protein
MNSCATWCSDATLQACGALITLAKPGTQRHAA